MGLPKYETHGRLLAKLVWELLKAERFDTLADLTDALKCRCARLRISCTPDDVNAAYRLIESNTKLVPSVLQPVKRGKEHHFDGPTLSRDEAEAIHDRLITRYRAEQSR